MCMLILKDLGMCMLILRKQYCCVTVLAHDSFLLYKPESVFLVIHSSYMFFYFLCIDKLRIVLQLFDIV